MVPQNFVFKKVRKIKVTQSTDRGKIFSPKNVPDGYVEFESLGEESLFLLLDHDPHCMEMESQPAKVPNPNKAGITYIPDAWAKFQDGTEFVFDVKFHTFFEDLPLDPEKETNWKDRTNCIEGFCRTKGLNYMILTDSELRHDRFENVLFFRKNKREPQRLPSVKPILLEVLATTGGLSRIELAQRISERFQVDSKEIIPCIDHLIYFDHFDLDFESKITDDTILKLKSSSTSTRILPLPQYFTKVKWSPRATPPARLENALSEKIPNHDARSQREFLALPEKVQQRILGKIKHLEIFTPGHFCSKELLEYARQHGINKSTLYRWKKAFDEKGWVGLVSRDDNKGRKKGKNAKLEELIQKVIEERYLTRLQPSVSGCYRFLVIECTKAGIDVCHFTTFRRRVQEVTPKTKVLRRRGRKAHKDEFALLNGVFPFGRHPLDAVEIDHTVLDVVLVSHDHQVPIGRPVITVAIDAYSRMVCGYYLSFDAASSLSVGMCLHVGILDKAPITRKFQTKNDWPICGLPKRIICDNAKEFDGQAFLTFCQQYDIEIISNPVRSPEKKPHVERFFKTLNQSIRDDLIGGYVPPLAEKRVTQYNPEKHATMAFDEFELWLVHWIVDNYHQKIHDGIKELGGIEITPRARYVEGIASSGGMTVGVSSIPANLEQFQFDVLPVTRRQLSRGGISIFGLKYNAPIVEQLRAAQQSPNSKYLVRYDPRDIRELYLWATPVNKYYQIPLKNVYYPQLKIDPAGPADWPLSLQELNAIKRDRKKLFPVTQQELAEALDARQKIIEAAKTKTRAAKSGRKRGEVTNLHKTTSTSRVLGKTPLVVTSPANSTGSEDNHGSEHYPIETNWTEADFD